MPDVALFAASGPEVGMGHVVRTCAVAEAVVAAGAEPLVLVEDEASLAYARGRGLPAGRYNAVSVDELVAGAGVRGAWFDGFRDWSEAARELQGKGARLLLVENRTPARELADLVIHPSLHFEPDDWESARSETVRGGAAWIPLRTDVRAARGNAPRSIDLLVTLGGSDPRRSSEAVLAALAALRYDGRVVVTVGAHMAERQETLCALASELPSAEVRRGGAELPEWMAQSRVAVTAVGTTLYELAFLGVRGLILANYRDDKAALGHYERHGPHLPLGLAADLSPEGLAEVLGRRLAEAGALPAPDIAALGAGADRLAAELLGYGTR